MSNSTAQAPTPGQPIPMPPDFPVVWDDPRDAKLTWMSSPQFKTPISAIDLCRYRRVPGGRQCRYGTGRAAL